MAHKYDYPSGGKGDTRIPAEISEEEFSRRWEQTFGKKEEEEQDDPHDEREHIRPRNP